MVLPDYLMAAADEIGIKLEMMNGLTVWSSSGTVLHQSAIDRIMKSMYYAGQHNTGHGCFFYYDIMVQFPDGSLTRPDISVFSKEPVEQTFAVTMLPDAVIEIISKDYEAKGREIGVPFYISQNIRDIVLLDPYTGEVLHYVDGVKTRIKIACRRCNAMRMRVSRIEV